MKILIVNYAYFINGGPERYLFNIIGSLESYGHEVVPFSMRSKENINTEYGKYFVDAISTDGSWRYNSNYNFKSKLKQIIRIFFSFEVFFKIRRLILLKKPEIAYILHYHKK